MSMPRSDVVRILREQCNPAEDLVYFNSAAHGLLPRDGVLALEQYLEQLRHGATEQEFAPSVQRLRGQLAELIGAETAQVAFCKNISEGLNIVIQGFPWQRGDEIIVCPPDTEHPTLLWAAQLLAPLGVIIRTVPASAEGLIPVEAIANSMIKTTRMVALSHVSFLTGSRVDLPRLGQFCRDSNVFLLVDAAQSVGFGPVDVETWMIDGLVANTHKGLLGLAGLGFLCLSPRWLPSIRPLSVGAESVEGAFEDWRWAPTMRRFEVGHVNSAAAVVASATVDLVRGAGLQPIQDHILHLRTYLVQALGDRGLAVVAPEASSHIVSVVPKRASPSSVVEALGRRGIKAAVRGSFVRFSLHGYNTEADVDRLVLALKQENIG